MTADDGTWRISERIGRRIDRQQQKSWIVGKVWHGAVYGSAIKQDSRARPAGRPIDHIVAEPLKVRSEEHTSELQSLMRISYAVFCLKKKKGHLLRRHAVVTHNQTHEIERRTRSQPVPNTT